ncbi:MAG: hypothetical protein J6Y94_08965, partial [Bacteriovoracaceae bacterium]|nr:hypothetical protein [Bacteriovoracaceae bacterium]
MREWMSSSPTGVLGRFETSSTKNIEAINTQVLEDFKTLQTNGAEVEVYSSNNSLPPGIISKADGFVIQRGYRHQWLGCFKLVTEPKAVGDADHLAQEAKLMTAAAGGDFVFLPALLYDSSVRWQTMGGCAFKLDPRMKRKLQQATAADQAAYEKYLSSLPSPTPQVSSSVMEIEESIEVE